jgi:hypothetical protein
VVTVSLSRKGLRLASPRCTFASPKNQDLELQRPCRVSSLREASCPSKRVEGGQRDDDFRSDKRQVSRPCISAPVVSCCDIATTHLNNHHGKTRRASRPRGGAGVMDSNHPSRRAPFDLRCMTLEGNPLSHPTPDREPRFFARSGIGSSTIGMRVLCGCSAPFCLLAVSALFPAACSEESTRREAARTSVVVAEEKGLAARASRSMREQRT